MIDNRLFDELNERVAVALPTSPAADLEKNLRALLTSWFDRLDLVSREDFDVQRKLLERAQAKLAELEQRTAELQSRDQVSCRLLISLTQKAITQLGRAHFKRG